MSAAVASVQLLVLEGREPAVNIARFYVLSLEETLPSHGRIAPMWAGQVGISNSGPHERTGTRSQRSRVKFASAGSARQIRASPGSTGKSGASG